MFSAEVNFTNSGKVTFFDKILSKTILPLIPRFVTPNHVTTFRYITVPIILYFIFYGYYNSGIFLFLVSALSDAVDGSLARTRNQITDWGKIHDPMADKLLIGTVGAFVISVYLSVYIIISIIVIELFLILNAFFILRKGEKVAAALWPGKIKMVLYSFGVALTLLFAILSSPWLLLLASILLYAGIFFALVSLIVYGSI